MKKSHKITLSIVGGVITLGIVGALVGPIIYSEFIAEEAAPVPTLSATSTPAATDSAPIDPASFDGEWTSTSGSFAGYRVDEVLNGTDVTVTARTEDLTATVTVAGAVVTAATIEVDVASIESDNSNRDDYFRTQAIDTDTFPTASFVLNEAVAPSTELVEGVVQTITLNGDLTINGVSNSVSVSLEVLLESGQVSVSGSVPITFSDFNVEAPSLGFVSVEDTGSVEFRLSLVPAS